MNFRNLTVKGQLTFAFGLLTALLLVIAIAAAHALGRSHENFTEYSKENVAQAQLVTDVRGAVNRRAVAARNLVLVTTPQEIDAEKQAVLAAHKDTERLLGELKSQVDRSSGTTDEEKRLVNEIYRVEGLYGPVPQLLNAH